MLDAEDEGTKILSNLGKCPPSDIAEHPRIPTIFTLIWRFLQHT